MIQNYDEILKWSAKFGKIYTLWKFIFIQQWLAQSDLLGQLHVFLITSCKRFHSKKNSYEKMKKNEKRFIVFL